LRHKRKNKKVSTHSRKKKRRRKKKGKKKSNKVKIIKIKCKQTKDQTNKSTYNSQGSSRTKGDRKINEPVSRLIYYAHFKVFITGEIQAKVEIRAARKNIRGGQHPK